MDIMALIAAFGGGVIGAYMGALPAFIMAGVLAIGGGIATAAGAPADIAVGYIAFGSFLGPHIAFGGGVAAAAYAGKAKKLEAGNNILASLYGLGAPDVLLIGGVFGVLAFLIQYLIGITPLGPKTDSVAMTVAISGIIARLCFGKTGLTGKYEGTGKRVWFTGGTGFVQNVVLGGGVGIAASFVAASMKSAGVSDAAMGIFPVICFGFSAISLIFAQTGFAMPGTHHISLPAASAAVFGVTAFGPAGALLGVVFGILGSLLGDWAGNTFNSHCDTHIDPPAFAIFISILLLSGIQMAFGA